MVRTDKNHDVWAPFRFFVGQWEGKSEGCSGGSRTEWSYMFVLDGKFLQVRNKSTFEPHKKNPKGETHEEIGFLGYDGNREKFVLRQFHVEGFVNQYVLESLAHDGKTIVFVTESMENLPIGWRAKETQKILKENEFSEIFELAAPANDFEVYMKTLLRRKE